MPIYDIRCQACGNTGEVIVTASDAPVDLPQLRLDRYGQNHVRDEFAHRTHRCGLAGSERHGLLRQPSRPRRLCRPRLLLRQILRIGHRHPLRIVIGRIADRMGMISAATVTLPYRRKDVANTAGGRPDGHI